MHQQQTSTSAIRQKRQYMTALPPVSGSLAFRLVQALVLEYMPIRTDRHGRLQYNLHPSNNVNAEIRIIHHTVANVLKLILKIL